MTFLALTALAVAGVLFVCSAAPLPRQEIHAVTSCLALASMVAVPLTRLPDERSALELAVFVFVIAMSSIAVVFGSKSGSTGFLVLIVALFFGLEAIATSLEPDPNEWRRFLLLAAVSIASVAVGLTSTEINARRIRSFLVAIGLVQAALAILEVVLQLPPIWVGARKTPTGTTRLHSELIPGLDRAQGTLAHPILLGLLMSVAVAIVAFRLRQREVRLWNAIGMLALLLAGISAAGSRSMLAIALLTLMTCVMRAASAPLALAAALLMSTELTGQIHRLQSSGSWTHRLEAFTSVDSLMYRDITRALIGDGSASTPRLYASGLLQRDGLEAVDNQFVLLIAQNGLIGIGIILWVVSIALMRSSGVARIVMLVFIAAYFIVDLLSWPSLAAVNWVILGSALRHRQALNASATSGPDAIQQPKIDLMP